MKFYCQYVKDLVESDNRRLSYRGLCLCKNAKNTIVEWSLQDIQKPLGVATYQLEQVVERTIKELEQQKKEQNEK